MTLIEVPLDSAPSEWEQLRAALVSIRISDAVSEVEPVPFSGRAPHILRKAESGFVGLERGNRSKATILTDGLELVQSFDVGRWAAGAIAANRHVIITYSEESYYQGEPIMRAFDRDGSPRDIPQIRSVNELGKTTGSDVEHVTRILLDFVGNLWVFGEMNGQEQWLVFDVSGRLIPQLKDMADGLAALQVAIWGESVALMDKEMREVTLVEPGTFRQRRISILRGQSPSVKELTDSVNVLDSLVFLRYEGPELWRLRPLEHSSTPSPGNSHDLLATRHS